MRTRTKTKPTTLSIGTISEGTLLPQDLLDALLCALNSIRLTRGERMIVRVIEKAHRASFHDDDGYHNDADWSDIEDLIDIVNDHCPPYCSYGSAEGDGACFGVWPDMDDLEESARYAGDVRKVNAGDEWPKPIPEHIHYVMSVTDHGNVTLYNRRGRELWAVV